MSWHVRAPALAPSHTNRTLVYSSNCVICYVLAIGRMRLASEKRLFDITVTQGKEKRIRIEKTEGTDRRLHEEAKSENKQTTEFQDYDHRIIIIYEPPSRIKT